MAINTVTVIVGARNHGKTIFTKELVAVSPLPKKLIVDTFDNPVWKSLGSDIRPEWNNIPIGVVSPDKFHLWKNGLYLSYHKNRDYMMGQIAQHISNCLVVIEDSRRFLDRVLKKSHAEIITNSKQRNVNLIFVFHSLSQVPKELLHLADYITLFKTTASEYDTKKYDFDGFKELFEYVNNSPDQYVNATIRIN